MGSPSRVRLHISLNIPQNSLRTRCSFGLSHKPMLRSGAIRWSPSGDTFCPALPRVPICSHRQRMGQPLGTEHKPLPTQCESTTCNSESHFDVFFSPTFLRPWAFVFKTEMRERQLSWPGSFQKALEDWVDEKNKNKSKPADKSITQRSDSSQERALQSADCKVIDRGFHFTHCHSNLAVSVLQCQDRSLIKKGTKREQKRRNNYRAQGTKHRKGKGHLFKCSEICSTENFHSQTDVLDSKGKRARWKQRFLA